jgi:hypothetical protein
MELLGRARKTEMAGNRLEDLQLATRGVFHIEGCSDSLAIPNAYYQNV